MKHSVLNHETTSIQTPPTTNKHLIRWVEKMAELCRPDSIHWVDGTKEEYDFLCDRLVDAGTFTRLDQKKWPGCFYARSAPNDVARVEDRTFMLPLPRWPLGRGTSLTTGFDVKTDREMTDRYESSRSRGAVGPSGRSVRGDNTRRICIGIRGGRSGVGV